MSFEDTNYFFGRAMNVMDVGRGIEDLLLTPNRSVSVKIPLEMDDGHVRVFQGYRVQHNNARGLYKGACATRRTWTWTRSGRSPR